jgi:hypothetical protein
MEMKLSISSFSHCRSYYMKDLLCPIVRACVVPFWRFSSQYTGNTSYGNSITSTRNVLHIIYMFDNKLCPTQTCLYVSTNDKSLYRMMILCGLVVRVPGYRSRGPGSNPALPDCLRSSGSGTGSTQPREYN